MDLPLEVIAGAAIVWVTLVIVRFFGK